MISLLFDSALPWKLVATDSQSSTQLFAYMPVLISNALSVDSTEVQTYALQVFEPSTYTSTEDADALETMFVAWIPTGQVDTLAQQLLASNSPFYTVLGSPYSDLARHVVPSFPVEAVTSGGSTGSSGGSGSTSSDTASASSSSKTREDAIIGVVSSLGAITLIVLAFLVVRAVKQRRALAHHRLSDPQIDETAFVGARPDNQEFDRDSLGGQRRRSFYYAEDSLRYEGASSGQAATQAGTSIHPMMRERRGQNVNAQMIGAPVLRDNTMNW